MSNEIKEKTFIKTLNIVEVALTPQGSNPGAYVELFKSDDHKRVAKQSFNEALMEMEISEKLEELMEAMYDTNMALRRSISDTIRNPAIKEKKTQIKENLNQFMSAMTSMVDDTDVIKEFKKAAGKTEGGKVFPASDYAYVPDSSKPSTWKLRLTSTPGGPKDPRIVGAAVAALGKGFRGNKVQIPSKDLSKVKSKVRSAWLAANKGKNKEDLPSILKSEGGSTEMSEEIKKQLEEMTARLERSEAIAKMDDTTKSYFRALDDNGQLDFLTKSDEDRAEIIRKANEEDESFTANGQTIYKSVAGEAMFAFAKAQQAKIDATEALAKAEQEKNELNEFAKQAQGMYPNLTGDPLKTAKVMKAIASMDKDTRETLSAMLKQGDEAIVMSKAFDEIGSDGIPINDGSPIAKLNKLAEDKAKADNITFHKAYDDVLKTSEGQKLYTESLKQ
jgi:hypothetical protein